MQVRAIMTAALEAQKNGATVQVCPSVRMDGSAKGLDLRVRG